MNRTRDAGREPDGEILQPVHQWGLTARVVLAQVLLLTVLLAIILIGGINRWEQRRQAEINNTAAIGTAVAGIVDAVGRDLEATTLAASLALASQPEAPSQAQNGEYLSALVKEYQFLRALFVTDTTGRVVAAQAPDGLGSDLSSRPYMVALMGGAPSVWAPAVPGLQTGEIVATYGRVIGTPAAPRGYLIAAFYGPSLSVRMAGRIPSDGDVTLVDRFGEVLFSTQREILPGQNQNVSQAPAIRSALDGAAVRVDGPADFFNNARRYGIVAPVEAQGWAVAFTRPLDTLEASLRQQLIEEGAPAVLAVVVIGAVLGLAVRRIAQPLKDLAQAADAIARGESPVIAEADGDAQVQVLAKAMHAMKRAIDVREADLEEQRGRAEFLASVSQALGSTLDPELTLKNVGQLAVPGIADWFAVDALDDSGQLRRLVVSHSNPDMLRFAAELQQRYPTTPRLPEVVAGGEPALYPEITDEMLVAAATDAEHLELLRTLGMRAAISAPLVARDRVLGMLTLVSAESGRRYGAEDVQFTEAFAGRVAAALDNAHLYQAVERALESRNQFLMAISHDLRNPLAAVMGTAQLLQRTAARGNASPERVANSVEVILSAAGRIQRMIASLLDFARLQAGQGLDLNIARVSLQQLVTAAAADLQPLTTRHELRIESAEPIEGEWDADRLRRVFGNLLDNAAKYSPEGGEIRVTLEAEPGPPPVAVVSVEDHGIGIPPDDVNQLFVSFYRASNAMGQMPGLGIGLASARAIVEQHGGRMYVTSELGKGSVFYVRLPILRQISQGKESQGEWTDS